MPELSRHYEIDVVVAQQEISDPYIAAAFPIRTVEWFRHNARKYDRVLYHFGNSHFHEHMFGLLQELPGVVVLHDFFLSGMIRHMDIHGPSSNIWASELYNSHGYEAVRQRFHAKEPEDIAMRYPCNLTVLQHAQGVIVHSANSLRLAEQWQGKDTSSDWALIPFLRERRIGEDKLAARKALGFGVSDFLVCAFGILGPIKLNERLLQAWLKSRLARDRTCYLVFVGKNHPGDYGREILATIRSNQAEQSVHVTGWVDMDVFRQYLAAADIAVQLRTFSRGETSAAVFDCMNYGLATIVNAHGSMADLDENAVCKLPDEFTDAQLIEALETLWKDAELRNRLGARGQAIIVEKHDPRTCAAQYYEAIEQFSIRAASGTRALASAIAGIEYTPDDRELIRIAEVIARNMPLPLNAQQLLLDISATCHNELKTGIERVARALTLAFLEGPPEGFRIEPVYLSDEGGAWHYRYARRFTLDLLGCPPDALADDAVELQAGDVLLGLDNSGHRMIQAEAAGLFADYRNRGVAVYFTVFDLLPLRLPQHFPPGADEVHAKWVRALLKTDGVLCISRTAADDLRDWARAVDRSRQRPFRIGWFHLGADIADAALASGMPEEAAQNLAARAARPSFLMVGTVEPREGYLQVLDAFDRLWSQGVDVNLTIVGAEGWQHVRQAMRRTIPDILARLQSHPERGRRLFWVNGPSDEYLEKIYAASSCLIAASESERFGLPLIEAARHRLPIIARDIAVFREVAGEHAFYFAGKAPEALAAAIKEWLALYDKGKHPKSDALPWMTWRQSAERLQDILLRSDWYTSLTGEGRQGAGAIAANKPAVLLPKHISWRIEGPFDSTYSLALLNRETARALSELGHHVVLHSTEGPGDFLPSEDFLRANPDFAELYARSATTFAGDVEVTSRNLYPPRVADMHSRFNLLHHYAWEESGFPAEWAKDFNNHLDGVTCLSSHVEKILVDHGVTARLSVSGCGVDHWERIEPAAAYRIDCRSFRFLHVSSCFPRKGADVLLKAYGASFTNFDDVTLVIKTFDNPHNEIEKWLAEVDGVGDRIPLIGRFERAGQQHFRRIGCAPAADRCKRSRDRRAS